MKFMAMTKYVGFTAMYYDYSVTTGPDAINDRTYTSTGTSIEFNGGIAGNSSSLIVYTKDKAMRMFARLDSVRDRNNLLIAQAQYSPTGVVYEVRTVQPLLSPWGLIEGYRHTLVAVG